MILDAVAELLRQARAGKKPAIEESIPCLYAPSVYSKISDDGSYHDTSAGLDDASDASLLRAQAKHRGYNVQKSGLAVSVGSQASETDWSTVFTKDPDPYGEETVRRTAGARRVLQKDKGTWSLPTKGLVTVGNALMEVKTGITVGKNKRAIRGPYPISRRPFK